MSEIFVSHQGALVHQGEVYGSEEEIEEFFERAESVQRDNIRLLGYPEKADRMLRRQRRRITLGLVLSFWPMIFFPLSCVLGLVQSTWVEPYPALYLWLLYALWAVVWGGLAWLCWADHERAFWVRCTGRPIYTEEELEISAREMYRADMFEICRQHGWDREIAAKMKWQIAPSD